MPSTLFEHSAPICLRGPSEGPGRLLRAPEHHFSSVEACGGLSSSQQIPRTRCHVPRPLLQVEDLLLEEGCKGVTGVRTEAGEQLRAQCVVITTGTFLRGVVHIGRASRPAGRINGPGGLDSDGTEPPATALATTLARLSLPLGRLKTGTPPRLDARTIAWEELEPQPSEQYAHVQLEPRTSRSAPDLLRTLRLPGVGAGRRFRFPT